MNRRLRGAFFIGFLSLGSLCLATPPASEIQQLLNESVTTGRIPSAVVLLATDDKVDWFTTVGEFSPGIAMRQDSIMPLSSVGKMFTATAAMILIEREKIALDDPVSKFIAEFGSTDGHAIPVTVYHLLTHTSGLTVDGAAFWDVWDDHVGRTTTTQFAEALAVLPRNPPGEQFDYGQTGAAYEVLGAVIEIASGQTLEVFMQENIFKPLALEDSSFYVPADQSDRLPAIYRQVDGTLVLDREQGRDFPRSTFFHGGGGVRTSLKDIHRFARMLLNGGEVEGVRVLQAATVDQMFIDHLGDKAPLRWQKRGLSWGYGAAVNHSTDGALQYYTWTGGGATKLLIDFPDRKIAFIGIPMAPPGDHELLVEFERLLYAD